MREMKDSGIEWIGEIPKDKEVIRNKYLLTFEKGKIPSDTNSEGIGFPYIGASNLDVDEQFKVYTEDDTLPEAKYDDLLVLWDGARAGLAGRHKEGKISSTVVKIQPSTDSINKTFFYWYYLGFEKYMFDCVSGTTIPHMNRKYIESIGFINWSLEEQQKIANYLDDKCSKIDKIIEKEQVIIEKLKEYKQSLITEAVTKGLDTDVEMKDSGVEWIGEIPESWEILKFGYYASIKSNLVNPENYMTYKQISPECIEKNSGKLIEVKTVKEAGIISFNHLFFKDQIIYSKIRPTLNKVIIAPFSGLCSADMYPIETDQNTKFTLYTMLSKYFNSQVGMFVENRVKMPKINQTELSSVLIAVPNKDEQKQIADYLDFKCNEIDKAISNKESLIEKLTEYKKSLIYEVVTGKKEV